MAVREAELKRNVSAVFYNLVYLGQKKQLLLRNDSLYSDFQKKAELRFSRGESNVLEKTAAQLQRSQIYLQLAQITQDIELLRLQFQLLLNSAVSYLPDKPDAETNTVPFADTVYIPDKHPHIRFLEQQKRLSLLNTKLEKAKLLPELSLMYNNMSMKGTGADNRFYNSSTRFQSGQVGIGVPLFFGSQKARINAARSYQLIADNNYLSGLQAMRTEYQLVMAQYKKHLQTLDYLKNNVMNTIPVIAETANKQFNSGSINYLEWVMLINQSVILQNEYIETTRNLNESLIHLNYLQAK